ncbi:MAG: hypothetical protein ACFCU1_06535 [Sumerlaeia bacterium]
MSSHRKSSKLPIISILFAAIVVIVAVVVINQKQTLQYALPVAGIEQISANTNVVFEGEIVGSVISTNAEERNAVVSIFPAYRSRLPLPDFIDADAAQQNGRTVLKLTRLDSPAAESSLNTQAIMDSAESLLNTSVDKLNDAKRWFETGTGNELRLKTQDFLADLERKADSKSAEVRQEVFVKLAEGEQLVRELKTRYNQEYAAEVEQTLSTIREKAEAVSNQAKETVQDITAKEPEEE